jgi:hypothetical protein
MKMEYSLCKRRISVLFIFFFGAVAIVSVILLISFSSFEVNHGIDIDDSCAGNSDNSGQCSIGIFSAGLTIEFLGVNILFYLCTIRMLMYVANDKQFNDNIYLLWIMLTAHFIITVIAAFSVNCKASNCTFPTPMQIFNLIMFCITMAIHVILITYYSFVKDCINFKKISELFN